MTRRSILASLLAAIGLKKAMPASTSLGFAKLPAESLGSSTITVVHPPLPPGTWRFYLFSQDMQSVQSLQSERNRQLSQMVELQELQPRTERQEWTMAVKHDSPPDPNFAGVRVYVGSPDAAQRKRGRRRWRDKNKGRRYA